MPSALAQDCDLRKRRQDQTRPPYAPEHTPGEEPQVSAAWQAQTRPCAVTGIVAVLNLRVFADGWLDAAAHAACCLVAASNWHAPRAAGRRGPLAGILLPAGVLCTRLARVYTRIYRYDVSIRYIRRQVAT